MLDQKLNEMRTTKFSLKKLTETFILFFSHPYNLQVRVKAPRNVQKLQQ
jgi:hypothetical protein